MLPPTLNLLTDRVSTACISERTRTLGFTGRPLLLTQQTQWVLQALGPHCQLSLSVLQTPVLIGQEVSIMKMSFL